MKKNFIWMLVAALILAGLIFLQHKKNDSVMNKVTTQDSTIVIQADSMVHAAIDSMKVDTCK